MHRNATYVGTELELFRTAQNWKRYYGAYLQPHLKGAILEVGAGLGGTTASLCDGTQDQWVCLEPDPELSSQIDEQLSSDALPSCCRSICGTIESLPSDSAFDSILYIDVIEHIEDDAAELSRAAEWLKPGGHLLIVVPANQWLFSPFDEAVGHFRRYSRKRLAAAVPNELVKVRNIYLDSVGMCASAMNRFALKQTEPSLSQVQFWDRTIVPVSRILDRLLLYSIGKSVLGIWQRPTS
jgi:SAM-dependent methyltransferase